MKMKTCVIAMFALFSVLLCAGLFVRVVHVPYRTPEEGARLASQLAGRTGGLVIVINSKEGK